MIGALVGTAGLGALEGGLDDGLGQIEHVAEFEGRGQLGVERITVIGQLEV